MRLFWFTWVALLLGFATAGDTQQTDRGAASFEDGIRECSAAFVTAYNQADADALASLFVENGEFIDVKRTLYSGRDAIRQEFAAAFQAAPGSALNSRIDSIRQISKVIALEDGQVTVAREGGPAYVSRYMAVYTRVEETWKLASLRDLSSVPLTNGERLMDLQWMIGDWVSESAEGVIEHSFYWSQDGNFILGNFDLRVDGQVVSSGNQRIGWDPQIKQIRAWVFDTEGSYVQSTWSRKEERWMVKTRGVAADGQSVSATNFYVPGENHLSWISTDRIVGGESVDDVRVKMVRKPPKPGDDADSGKR